MSHNPWPRRWRTVSGALIALIALHYVVVGLYTFEIIPQVFNPPDRVFWFHHGGDNAEYFALAQSILHGEVAESKYPIGFPLTLIPFIAVFQPQTQEQLIEPVAAFWALMMFPIGQLLLYRLGALLTGKRRLALLAVFIWTLLPLVMWMALRVVASAEVAETSSVHLIWAQMLSDGPATLLTILAFLLYAEYRDAETTRRSLALAGMLGLTMGFLILVRYTGALSVAAILALLLIEHHWRGALIAGLAAGAVASAQLVYNLAFFGSGFTTGYMVLDTLPERGLFHPGYLLDALHKLWDRSGVLFLIGSLGGAAGLVASLWAISRINRWSALVVALWILPYLAFYSVYFYSWDGGLPRFLIPIYPALALLAAALLTWGWAALRAWYNPSAFRQAG